MSAKNELLNRINNSYNSMSKGQKILATYITDNYDKAVFLTAAKLGETVGVSESTVVRFAMHLGYKGYPEFQKSLEELVRNKLNSIQRMEVTYGRISQSEILQSVLQSDAEKIKGIVQVSIVHGVGEKVGEIRRSVDRAGFVIAQTDDANKAINICMQSMKKIIVNLV